MEKGMDEQSLEERYIYEIRNKIEGARISVNQGMDSHKAFDFVYDYMVFSYKLGLLKRESLDTLWNELREATNN